jgi:chromosome partitioning protein
MKAPKTICVACSKGGVAKSTTAINLAVALSNKYPVEVLDLDYQKSVSIFNQIREQEGIKPLTVRTATDENDVKNFINKNKTILIIDTGAFDTPVNRRAMIMSDMVITPISDSPIDLYGLLKFQTVIKDLKEAAKDFRAYILPSKIEARRNDLAEIADLVKKHNKIFKLFKTVITSKKEYKNVLYTGRGVTEAKRKGAGAEIITLVKEIEKCLK